MADRKPIFEGKVFVLQGDLGKSGCPIRSHENITRLIEHHGGEVDDEVTRETTYLICSIKDFNDGVPAVKQAKKHRYTCKVVTWDFIEDSVARHKVREIDDKFYELRCVVRRVKKAERQATKHIMNWHEDMNITKDLADPQFHHHYVDSTGFKYFIVLTRVTMTSGKIKRYITEKYRLALFESNLLPHTYMVGARYNRPGYPTFYYKDKLIPSHFSNALADWKKLFKAKTGIEWDDRLKSPEVLAAQKAADDAKLLQEKVIGKAKDFKRSNIGENANATKEAIMAAEAGTGEDDDEHAGVKFRYIPPLPDQPRGELPADMGKVLKNGGAQYRTEGLLPNISANASGLFPTLGAQAPERNMSFASGSQSSARGGRRSGYGSSSE